MRHLAIVLFLSLAGPALADEPIATAPTTGPAAPQPSAALPPLAPPKPDQDLRPPLAMGPCGPEKVKADGSLETAPHGEVSVGAGSRGYREIGGAACQPIGQNGAVAISIDEAQEQRGRPRF